MSTLDYSEILAGHRKLCALYLKVEQVRIELPEYRFIADSPFILYVNGQVYSEDTENARLLRYGYAAADRDLRDELVEVARGIKESHFDTKDLEYLEARAALILRWAAKCHRRAEHKKVRALKRARLLN